MKIDTIKKKSKTDLKKELEEKRRELRRLRFGLTARKVQNTSKIKKTKKDIARILTVINQK